MKKSKIVSYTSEELKQRPSLSDWEANAAMTDDEIEAAIASDPEEAAMHEGWMKRAKVVRRKPLFFMCISNKGYKRELTVHKVYKSIRDDEAEKQDLMHTMDDTGKEQLFPASHFVPVQIPVEAEKHFELEVA